MIAAVESALADLEKRAADWPIPGLQVAVVGHGDVLFAGGFGECTAETLMHHGSCGKAYTAAVATSLSAEGLVDLDGPVRDHVPELRTPDPYLTDRLTLRDLLSHRSGLGRHDFLWVLHPELSTEELVRRLAFLALGGEFRAGLQYSNIGYALAGLALSRAAATPWSTLLRERVLSPLGMAHTYSGPDALDSDLVKGQPYVLDGGRPVLTQWRLVHSIAPAGELVTTAPDAARWLLLHSGAEVGSPELREAARSTHQLTTPVPREMSPWPELHLYGYGLGWLIATYRGRPALLHAGGIDGFLTETLVLPEDGFGVTVSANVHMSDLPLPATLAMADAALGTDGIDWYRRAQERGEPAEAPAGTPERRPPTQDLAAFAGTYRHQGYGDLVVSSQGDQVSVGLGAGRFEVSHRSLDTWDLRYPPLDARFTMTFLTGADGKPAEAVVPFDDGTAPIRFSR